MNKRKSTRFRKSVGKGRYSTCLAWCMHCRARRRFTCPYPMKCMRCGKRAKASLRSVFEKAFRMGYLKSFKSPTHAYSARIGGYASYRQIEAKSEAKKAAKKFFGDE